MTKEDINTIATAIAGSLLLCQKELLTSEEAARYMGISLSHLYKLTAAREIPHYKPTGKLCYFKRKELEAWIQKIRIDTSEELDAEVEAYLRRNPFDPVPARRKAAPARGQARR